MEEKECKIIGWGLAGSIMAWHLYFSNRGFQIYDSGVNHSTRTAAGLVNPIVFKRLTKSWNADKLVPYAQLFYQKIEKELNVKLVSQRSILRIFASVEEENNWSSKCGDERFEKYIKPAQNIQLKGVDAPFGVGEVNTFGNLDTKLFLDHSKAFFEQKGIKFTRNKFDYYDVNESDCFMFCEGVEVKNNFFFNYLPLKPTQGETIIIKTKTIDFKDILNKNMFVLPLGNGLFKVGATYNWEMDKPEITLVGKNELIEKLNRFFKLDFEVVGHEAGIRPTVSDRRPLIGTHPENENLHIFNGLGTKGVMIGPYYANHLLQHVFGNAPLEKEVDIARYLKFFSPTNQE